MKEFVLVSTLPAVISKSFYFEEVQEVVRWHHFVLLLVMKKPPKTTNLLRLAAETVSVTESYRLTSHSEADVRQNASVS